MKKIYTILLSLIVLLTVSTNSNSQTLEVSGSIFLPQDSISFTYADPPFTSIDWIGIYQVDQVPGTGPTSISWDYVTGTSGTLKLAAPQTGGNYKAFLLCCDGYDIMATSADFSVDVPYVTPSYPSFLKNSVMEFSFKSPKFTAADRIAVFTKGTKPGVSNPPVYSKYLTIAAGTITFQTDLTPGFYDAYLLCCDGYDSISSCTFEVIDPAEAFVIPKSDVFVTGSTLEFSYNDPLYADGDWIGIYAEYDDPTMSPSITWSKLVSQSGIVSFPGVIASGTYNAILFCCSGTTTEYARSVVFEVAEGATDTYVKTASNVYPEFTSILVNYRDNDFASTDWIGIYKDGDIPGGPESLVWYYAPADSGTMEFASTLAVGDYVVYLLCCDGYSIKAKSNFKIVNSGTPYLVSSKIAYANGEPLEFTYNSPSFVSTDWVGIYKLGEVPGGDGVYSTLWKYLPDGNGVMPYSYPDDYGENPQTSPLAPGEYWAGLFCCDAYGLYAQTTFIVTEFGLGVKQGSKSVESLNIFPNPTTGQFTVKVGKSGTMKEISVYNLTGQAIYRENNVGPVYEKTLDLKLNKGIYFMEVRTENSTMSKKLIIQ